MTEQELHKFTFHLLTLAAKPGVLYLHIPNGIRARGPEAKKAGRWQRKMGIKPGAADWLIIIHGEAFFLELKSKKGVQSEDQEDFEFAAKGAGSPYVICRTPEQVQAQLTKWRALRAPAITLGTTPLVQRRTA